MIITIQDSVTLESTIFKGTEFVLHLRDTYQGIILTINDKPFTMNNLDEGNTFIDAFTETLDPDAHVKYYQEDGVFVIKVD